MQAEIRRLGAQVGVGVGKKLRKIPTGHWRKMPPDFRKLTWNLNLVECMLLPLALGVL